MKKLLMASCLLSAPVLAVNGVNPGSSLTYGPTATEFSTFAGTYNPAMAPLMVSEDEKFRMTYGPSISMSVELGDVGNFSDDLDELIDILDDPSLATDSADETRNRFNDVLVQMGQDGYIKNSINVSIPITPLYIKSESLNGTFYAEANFGAQISLGILDEELLLDTQGTSFSFTTDTSIYLKAGIEKKLAIGYGTELLEATLPVLGEGTLLVGTKLSFYDMELSKQITRLEDLGGDEVSDVMQDEYDNNLVSSTGIGLDVGAVWNTKRLRLGARLQNINEPSFKYGALGVNCESRDPATIERNSCEVARFFIDGGRLAQNEKHVKHALLSFDLGVKITERLTVNGSYDTASYDDIVGYENQMLNLSLGYDSKGMFIPDVRVGYQENMVGTGTSSYLAGFSLFNVFTLDLEYGAETVEVDGSKVPRKVGFAIGFEESF